jgi:hypothetical protein
MEAMKQQTSSNDYAVAKALNNCVIDLFLTISNYQIIGPLKEFDPNELNRIYILLVDELEKIYDRNPKLTEIKPEPTWRQFEMLKGSLPTIQKYLEVHDPGKQHRDKVERLCIVAGSEKPDYSPAQKKIVDSSKAIHDKYIKLVIREIKTLPPAEQYREWYIPEYKLTYKLDGSILINEVLKLKKVHIDSAIDRLMEQAIKNPNKPFRPKIGQTARNLSTVISSAGFTPTLREIFFPIVSEENGIVFRPRVTFAEVLADRIDTSRLDKKLVDAGAIPHLFTQEVLDSITEPK